MKQTDFTFILKTAVASGAEKALAEAGIKESDLSKSKAYRLYCRSTVDRWVAEGLIVPIAEYGKTLHKCIDRLKLDAVAHASNRITYLPVAER